MTTGGMTVSAIGRPACTLDGFAAFEGRSES